MHLGVVNQSFWIATDPHRYLVKFEANAVDAQPIAIGQVKPGESRRYEDAKLGFSLAAPSDWFFYEPTPGKVFVLDPDAVAMTAFFAVKLAELDAKQRESLRAWTEARAAEAGKTVKNFKIRPASWKERTVAGLPALSLVADYTDGKRKMVHYITCVHGKSIGLEFVAATAEGQLEGFRKPLDAIVDSLKVK